jgi:hypothetical protein
VRGSLAVLLTLFALAGCAGGGSQQRGGRLSKEQYLSALQALPAPMRTGSTGAPVVGLVVSGTITNGGKTPLRCSTSAFVVISSSDDVAPSAEFCAMPLLAPAQSTYFNASFPTAPRDDLQLRFEHGDGTYEVHALIVPPG